MIETQRLRNITVLLASTMTVMAGATIAPSLPDMETAFKEVPNAELLVKLVLTIPGLMIAIGAPLVGILLDHWHKKAVLVMATVLYGVAGTSGFFLDQSLQGILAGRVFLGIAVAGIMVSCATLIGDYFTGAKRSHYMGLQAAFGGFGGVAFLALGGFLADVSWQMPFLIYALAFCILPFLIGFIDEPGKTAAGEAPSAGVDGATRLPGTLVAVCYAMAAMEVLALYMVPVHFPFFVTSLGDVSNTQIGFAVALMLLVMAVTSSFYRVFQLRASFQLLQGLGLAVLALGYVVLSLAEGYTSALAGLAVSGIGLGIIRPNLVVWIMSFTPPQVRGRVMGGLTTFYFIGQFICPILTQPLVQTVGYPPTFQWIGGAILILAILFMGAWVISVRSAAQGKSRTGTVHQTSTS